MPSEKRGPTCTKLNTLLRTESRQIIPLLNREDETHTLYLIRGTSPIFTETLSLPPSVVI